uniref:Uncharacterized protein n=1 Tax=Leersia perrieri TaxID=77586 RepID=A0A0D9WSH4_9ORYZ
MGACRRGVWRQGTYRRVVWRQGPPPSGTRPLPPNGMAVGPVVCAAAPLDANAAVTRARCYRQAAWR